jgi:MFS family permease
MGSSLQEAVRRRLSETVNRWDEWARSFGAVRLAASTAIGALGLAAGGSAGALLAKQMTASTSLAGLPLGVLVLGSAAGALLIARRTAQRGRAAGLQLGYGLGIAGALVVVAAAALGSFALLLVGSAGLGAANAAIFLTRYAAVELARELERGRAVGTIFAATALGAVASPNLLGPSVHVAEASGLPRLSGLYLVAALAFATAGLLLRGVEPTQAVSRVALRAGVARSRVALFVLAAANLVMVAVMAIAPVHLAMHGHGLDFVGVVISIHVLCMFGPSPLTGRLVDRAGSAYVVTLGAALLVAAGICGALLDVSVGTNMTAMLALLGLGWNAAVIGGTTMLAASTPAELRPSAEGMGEVAMGLAAGAGAPLAGLVVGLGSFTTLSLAAAAGGALVLAGVSLTRGAATLSALPS